MKNNFDIILGLLMIVIVMVNVEGQSDGNNIVFDLVDLTVDYQTDNEQHLNHL